MQPVIAVLGLLLAVVIGYLGVSQISGIEDNLETLTSGPLLGLVDTLTFWVLLLSVVAAIFALVGAVSFIFRKFS